MTYPQQVVLAVPNSGRTPIHSRSTVTTSGSAVVSGIGAKEVNLIVNIAATPTGTAPFLSYQLQEVDPGDQTTLFGPVASTPTINAIGINTISLGATVGGAIRVSWLVAGTAPSFTQVYATVLSKVGAGVLASPTSSQTTSVAASASSVTLLAANLSRGGATVFNDSSSPMYLKLGTIAASTSFTVKLVPLSYYEVPFDYLGVITGIWETATGDARITEVF